MARTRAEITEWESRWFLPTALVTFAAVVLLVVSNFVVTGVSGDGEAELLTSISEHSSDVTLSAILQGLGFVLLTAPLYFLFRAVSSRSTRVRAQLVGVVIAAPLFFAVSAVLNGIAANDAADQYAAGQAKSTLSVKQAGEKCDEDLTDKGKEDFAEEFDSGSDPRADCVTTKVADDKAENALSEASGRGLATGFALGGRLGLAVTLLYSCLWAMRVGLVTRFWGSLGMALGVAALLLQVQFVLVWFIYFGLLLTGRIPGGRPPAWAAGEAIPWPSPGEKAATEMEPADPDAIDVESEEVDSADAPQPPSGNGDGGEPPRKRKRRG